MDPDLARPPGMAAFWFGAVALALLLLSAAFLLAAAPVAALVFGIVGLVLGAPAVLFLIRWRRRR